MSKADVMFLAGIGAGLTCAWVIWLARHDR